MKDCRCDFVSAVQVQTLAGGARRGCGQYIRPKRGGSWCGVLGPPVRKAVMWRWFSISSFWCDGRKGEG
jgi:hypothetical protein